MKKLHTLTAFLLFLLVMGSQGAMACSCQPPSLAFFWDVVSPLSHNAMVSFVEIDEALSDEHVTAGRFVVLENYNIPGTEVKDTIIIRSGNTTCDFSMRYVRPGETLIVALYEEYSLYGGCVFNYLSVWQGSAEGQPLEEVRARIMNITSSSKHLIAGTRAVVHPNPASSTLHVTLPFSGRLPLKIEILDMTGRIIRTRVSNGTEETFPIIDLKNGLYLVRLFYDDKKFITRKWVKQ